MNLFRCAMRVADKTLVLECTAATVRDCAIAVAHSLLGSGEDGWAQLFIEEWSSGDNSFVVGPGALQRVALHEVSVVPPHSILSMRTA